MKTTLDKLTVVWLLMIPLVLPALTRAETAVQAWAQTYKGPGSSTDEPHALAVDSSNNVVVTGVSTNYSPYANGDYATIKYSSAGVPLWTNRYNNAWSDWATAVAVDSNNDVIVTGGSVGSGTESDYATIKYSSAGVPLWTNRYNGPGNGNDVAGAVAVDGSDNVIVTGYSAGGGSSVDYATIKYSSAGVPLWTNRYNGPENSADTAFALAVDGGDNVIVTGSSVGSGSQTDYATIKYSSAGVPLWTNRYNGPGNGNDVGSAVAVDSSNNVIVTGQSCGSGNNADYATIKYSSAGEPLWTNRCNGDWSDRPAVLMVDGSNDVIVTGSSLLNRNGATIKYSSAGVPLWTNYYPGPFWGASVLAGAVDGSNNVIVTGTAGTIKYSSAGIPLWETDPTSQPFAMTVDHSGNAILTGMSFGGVSGYDYYTVKYICVPSPVVTGLQLTNSTLYMRVDGVLQPGTLVIEASTNLTSWVPLFTNTTPTNVLFYADPNAGDGPARFYRVFQFP